MAGSGLNEVVLLPFELADCFRGVPHLVVARVEILADQDWRRTNAVQLQDHLL
jgi:hypothetical protein